MQKTNSKICNRDQEWRAEKVCWHDNLVIDPARLQLDWCQKCATTTFLHYCDLAKWLKCMQLAHIHPTMSCIHLVLVFYKMKWNDTSHTQQWYKHVHIKEFPHSLCVGFNRLNSRDHCWLLQLNIGDRYIQVRTLLIKRNPGCRWPDMWLSSHSYSFMPRWPDLWDEQEQFTEEWDYQVWKYSKDPSSVRNNNVVIKY